MPCQTGQNKSDKQHTFIRLVQHFKKRKTHVSFKVPEAKSQIFIVRSAEPVMNHSLPGSTATERTHPKWPLMTRINFHGACHFGFPGRGGGRRSATAVVIFILDTSIN